MLNEKYWIQSPSIEGLEENLCGNIGATMFNELSKMCLSKSLETLFVKKIQIWFRKLYKLTN